MPACASKIRASFALSFVLYCASCSRAAASSTDFSLYAIDAAHSTLGFSVRLVGFNRVRGSFDGYRGHILLAQEDLTRSRVSMIIDVGSIRTGVGERDEHLKSSEFFDAARFPVITFTSERIERAASGFVAIGPLSIHGVSREVRLPFVMSASPAVDPFGNTRVSFTCAWSLNRSDFGVTGPAFWASAISDAVEIELEIAGRRWNYERLTWPGGGKQSVGEMIVRKAGESGVEAALRAAEEAWNNHGSEPSWDFGLLQYSRAAGRLAQKGAGRDAAATLELALRLHGAVSPPESVASIRAQLAELYLANGNFNSALLNVEKALEMNRDETAAIVLAAHLRARK